MGSDGTFIHVFVLLSCLMMIRKDDICKEAGNQGVMFVPVVAGSDKTTVSVATGQQEYHPVYMSPGNLTNIARRAHGTSVMPVAFLPIPKGVS